MCWATAASLRFPAACCAAAKRSIPAEDDPAEPAGDEGKQHCCNAIEEAVVLRGAVDALLEARLEYRQLRRVFLDEDAVLEQEGAGAMRADWHVGRKVKRCAEQVLRQELDAADALAEQAARLLAL